MNLKWVDEIKPVLELQEFLDGLIELGKKEQGIISYEWWKYETNDIEDDLHSNEQVRTSSVSDIW